MTEEILYLLKFPKIVEVIHYTFQDNNPIFSWFILNVKIALSWFMKDGDSVVSSWANKINLNMNLIYNSW